MSDTTRVLFRVDTGPEFKGTITAVFVDEVERNGSLGCYAHVGQHGTASREWVRDCTRRATEAEAAPLRRELEAQPYGYRFHVLDRLPRRI